MTFFGGTGLLVVKKLEKINFDVMFVGDDWKGSKKWIEIESDFSKLGVEIMYFPYTTHTSSTLLKEALNKLTQP